MSNITVRLTYEELELLLRRLNDHKSDMTDKEWLVFLRAKTMMAYYKACADEAAKEVDDE